VKDSEHTELRSSIRVLHVIDTLGAAGAEHQLATLLPSLRGCGMESEVAVLQAPYTLAPLFEKQGIAVHRLDVRDTRNFLSSGLRLGKLLRRENYDIVHAHLWHSITAIALSKFISRSQKRVVTFHNSEYQQFPVTTVVRWLHRTFDRTMLRFAIDHCTSVTHFIARSNEALLRLPPTEVIFNGLDLTQFPAMSKERKNEVREQLGVREGEALIVSAGRLAEQKGYSVLVDAIDRLAGAGISARTLIFGEGPLRQSLQNKIVGLGLASKIQLPGSVNHKELFEAIAAADIFAFPSVNEPFGLAAAEAMALGTVVVASAVDGLPELIEDGVSGILVPARDPQALACALRDLVSHPEKRVTLALAGRSRARQLFDVTKISSEVTEFYRRVLGLKVQARVATEVTH